MLLQYAFEASRSGLGNLLFAIPIYNLLNAAVVALALYHLIPAKLRKSINGSRWMQAPLPPKLLAQVGRTKSRHSLKTRITVLVVIAIVLSAGIITLINASNTAMVSAYDQATKLINAGAFTGSVITPERVKEYLEKGAEAPGYEETAALLQSYVESTADLSRLYVLRIAEEGAMRLSFHAMSLPTARMVWHCPFISVFSSENGRVNGPGFREYMLLRLDGENWESDEHVNNSVQVEQKASFRNWNAWKDGCKQGIDCVVTIGRDGSRVTMQTENMGVAVSSVTTILDDTADVFVALTGDQVAITNVRVLREELE